MVHVAYSAYVDLGLQQRLFMLRLRGAFLFCFRWLVQCFGSLVMVQFFAGMHIHCGMVAGPLLMCLAGKACWRIILGVAMVRFFMHCCFLFCSLCILPFCSRCLRHNILHLP